MDILMTLVSHFKDDFQDLYTVSEQIPWELLTDWFFIRFKNNSIYHHKYFTLISSILNTNDTHCTKMVMKSGGLIHKIPLYYHDKQGNQAHILLLCELILDKSLDHLNGEFQSLLPILQRDLLKSKAQSMPPAPLKYITNPYK